MRGPCFDPVLLNNRQNPKLIQFLSTLLETHSTDVIVSHDRFTIYRATVIPDGDGEKFSTGIYHH